MKKLCMVLPLVVVLMASGCSCVDKKDITVKENTMETTNSGLKYIVVKEPTADACQPKKGDLVAVHYTGWLEENGNKGKE